MQYYGKLSISLIRNVYKEGLGADVKRLILKASSHLYYLIKD